MSDDRDKERPQKTGRSSPASTRIQETNRERILDAALEIFSTFGFRGTTIDMIAERAGMSKPNLLYYFRSKQQLHSAVLEHTLEEWLQPLSGMRADGEPLAEIEAYLERKIELSRAHPGASRLFATEIIQGAPHIRAILEQDLRRLVERKCAVIQGWIDAGKLAPIEPLHLIFMIWAMTQHYADFETQVQAVSGCTLADAEFAETARKTMRHLLLESLKPEKREASP